MALASWSMFLKFSEKRNLAVRELTLEGEHSFHQRPHFTARYDVNILGSAI